MVRNTTKPNKITSQRINFELLITRRSQVQVLSPQPTKNGKTSSFTVLFLLQAAKKKSGNKVVTHLLPSPKITLLRVSPALILAESMMWA